MYISEALNCINKLVFFEKSISVWSLIRLCGLDFIFGINRRVNTLIRATRVCVKNEKYAFLVTLRPLHRGP